jgi:branched-chain amino acid transport system ATP-binding protein
MTGQANGPQLLGAEAPPSGSNDQRALLAGSGLSAGYGGMAVVRDVDIEIGPGEVVALLGANGAGKTTLILTLAGAIQPLAGEVEWLGRSVRSPLSVRAREGLGLVSQERSVFMDLTLWDNLRLGLGDPEAALERFPEIRAHLKRRVGLLSGGQQQIIAVARILAANPKVLLADEISIGLAPAIVRRLLESITQAAREGVGVLLVEQHIEMALDLADRAYVLRHGRVELSGPTDELKDKVGDIEDLYLQSRTPSGESGR